MFDIGDGFKTGSKSYTIIDAKMHIPLVDSFVLNKRNSGNGEARLYVGSARKGEFPAFFENEDSFDCFVLKSNLKDCLSKEDYILGFKADSFTKPDEVRNRSISVRKELATYDSDEIDFKLKSRGDVNRYYIGVLDGVSISSSPFNLIRKIGIEGVTFVNIYKLREENGNVSFYLNLYADDSKFGKSGEAQSEASDETIYTTTTEEPAAKAESGPEDLPKHSEEKTEANKNEDFSQVYERWNSSCALTGISLPILLSAVRIKPSDECSANEVDDPENGIVLDLDLAALFQAGYFTFDSDGTVKVSTCITPAESIRYGLYGYDGKKVFDPTVKSDSFKGYVAYHRKNIFRG